MKHINLETFANGAFTAQVNRAIEEVTQNIQDPNTEPGAARKITVTIGFKPNQERNFVATGVQTRTTLAPALGAVTALSGQMSVADIQGPQPDQTADTVEVEGRTVDTATGEIAEESGKVIDLRKKA